MATKHVVVGIIGGGLSACSAAKFLQTQPNCRVVILEKGKSIGGRMSTHTTPTERRWDCGAMFFTSRSPSFQQEIDLWLQSGVAKEWTKGFDKSQDGYPRYCGKDGMSSIPQFLAQNFLSNVFVKTETNVTSILHEGRKWVIQAENGYELIADGLIMTAPAPETLKLVNKVPHFPQTCLEALKSIQYAPTLSVQVELLGPSLMKPPGGLQTPFPSIHFLCDNQLKGISNHPTVTVHADPKYSQENYEKPDEDICADLVSRCSSLIPQDQIRVVRLKRWKYAIPTTFHPERCLVSSVPCPIAFAGDSFLHARVEGAYLSGRAAASALSPLLTNP